jgi:hypothetical protein
LRVVLLEDRECVRLLDPGVVRNLVVSDEGGVGDGDTLDDVAERVATLRSRITTVIAPRMNG